MKQKIQEPTAAGTFDETMDGHHGSHDMPRRGGFGPKRGRGCAGRGRGACKGGPGRAGPRAMFMHMGPGSHMFDQRMGPGPYGGICPPWMQQQPAMWQFQPINLPQFGCPSPWAMNPGMARGPNACTGMRGGMMQRPVLMRRLRHLMKLMEEEKNAKSADENKVENQGEAEMTTESHEDTEAAASAAEKSEGKPAKGPHGRRHHIILRLQKMADAMSSSESGSSESETEKNDQEPRNERRRKMMKLMKCMKEDGEKLCKEGDGKPCTNREGPRGPRARMMHAGPWAAHSMMNEGGPGLPPQLLRRIRQLVKSMEENKAAEMSQEEEAAEGDKVPRSKKQQLRRLLHLLQRANGMRGPVDRQMPPWVAAQITGAAGGRPNVPLRLIERIRSLVRSMEDGDSSSKDEKMDAGEHNTSDENAEAGGATHTTDVSGEDNDDADGDDKKQRRQMRRLMRMLDHGGRPGPCGMGGRSGPCAMGGPRGMGMRGPAASAWAMPAFYGPPCMGMGPAAFGGLPPRFMRRMARCGNPARRMQRRQAREEMKKAKNADTEDVIGQSESDETPLNDWVELKKDINEME